MADKNYKNEKSLGCLTVKFIKLLQLSPNEEIDLKTVVNSIPRHKRRRIYDITNVLEGIDLVEKKNKCLIKWIGPKNWNFDPEKKEEILIRDIAELRELREKEMILDQQIGWMNQSVKNETLNPENVAFSYVRYQDIGLIYKNFSIMSVQAPPGTLVNLPIDNEQSVKKLDHQLHLKSCSGPISINLLSQLCEETENQYSVIKHEQYLNTDCWGSEIFHPDPFQYMSFTCISNILTTYSPFNSTHSSTFSSCYSSIFSSADISISSPYISPLCSSYSSSFNSSLNRHITSTYCSTLNFPSSFINCAINNKYQYDIGYDNFKSESMNFNNFSNSMNKNYPNHDNKTNKNRNTEVYKHRNSQNNFRKNFIDAYIGDSKKKKNKYSFNKTNNGNNSNHINDNTFGNFQCSIDEMVNNKQIENKTLALINTENIKNKNYIKRTKLNCKTLKYSEAENKMKRFELCKIAVNDSIESNEFTNKINYLMQNTKTSYDINNSGNRMKNPNKFNKFENHLISSSKSLNASSYFADSFDEQINFANSLDEPINFTNSLDEPINFTNSLDEPINFTNSLDEPINFTNSLDEPINFSNLMDNQVYLKTTIDNGKPKYSNSTGDAINSLNSSSYFVNILDYSVYNVSLINNNSYGEKNKFSKSSGISANSFNSPINYKNSLVDPIKLKKIKTYFDQIKAINLSGPKEMSQKKHFNKNQIYTEANKNESISSNFKYLSHKSESSLIKNDLYLGSGQLNNSLNLECDQLKLDQENSFIRSDQHSIPSLTSMKHKVKDFSYFNETCKYDDYADFSEDSYINMFKDDSLNVIPKHNINNSEDYSCLIGQNYFLNYSK